jgi:GNAT superfamily N-acetyltransferase
MNEITIAEYNPSHTSELLRLLLALHSDYFSKQVTAELQELKREVDIKKSYENYILLLNENKGDDWKVFLAISPEDKTIGFIIGSVEQYDEMVYGNVGKFEDWFVEDAFRKMGAGKKLYAELENWFRKKGCQQIISDTWNDYEASIQAHKELGFFISGISFSKKLE